MSFRRVVVLAAALAASAAMAQDAPQTAPAAPASVAAAASTAAPATPLAELPPLAGNATAGQGKAAVCGACHGMDGNSTDAQYPKLAGQNEPYIVHQLADFKNGTRQNPIMLGFASMLSPQDMHDVGAYFATKRSLPGVADQALVAAGQKLYHEGDAARAIPACMSCHGPDGRGNPGAMYPQLAGQHADYVQRTLKAWHDGTTWGTDAHAQIMPAIAKRLTDQDMAALASYIEGLHGTDAASAAPN
jgi:cytochrome c553